VLRLFSRNVGEFYNGKRTLPVFDWNPKAKTPIEIFHILMKPAEDLATCKMVPSLISHNVCFLLDVRNLASRNDWKSDDMGSWKNNGVQYHRYHVGQDEDFILENNDNSAKGGQPLIMKRIYYKNNSSPDVKKIISFLEGMYYYCSRCFCILSRTEANQARFFFRLSPSNLYSTHVRWCGTSC
jgi:hypothetical protein